MNRDLRKKTFLGFGLGAVQSGLMLFEAYKSKNFERFIILEVDNDLVKEIRKNNCTITINTATKNGIIKSTISGFEIYYTVDPNDQNSIAAAIYEADEMATAIPNTDYYNLGKNSIAQLLAKNINPNKSQIIYTAENNNYAAEILLEKIKLYTDNNKLMNFQALNTVIGKMGGVIQDEVTMQELGLDMITPLSKNAVLVEEFNDIIISKVELKNYRRGIEVFKEKKDLLPFEEAKLYGHNAVHSMLGFFAALRGYTFMSEIRNDPQLYQYGIEAFNNECGAFLLKKHRSIDDPLFTVEGFNFYGTDLLERMTNPYLRDEVQRICRDPIRKLGYDDRFFGTIREDLKQNIQPKILAKAVLGGICYIINNKIDISSSYPKRIEELNVDYVGAILKNIWNDDSNDYQEEACITLVASQLNEFYEEFITFKEY
jgi:mannitol-1-phosphate 5-dehydrogenase